MTTRLGGRRSKGARKQVALRVPEDIHAKLMAIKQVTGEDVNEQLLPFVIQYTERTFASLPATETAALCLEGGRGLTRHDGELTVEVIE